jgi:hypothetical protein
MLPGSSIFAALLMLLPAPAPADELPLPEQGVTPYGMGRAYSAAVDDGLALFHNPAGLALVKKVELQPFDVRLSSNQDTVGSISGVKAMGKSSASTVASVINQYYGKHIYFTGGDTSQVTIPYFSAALTYDVHGDFDLENQAYPQTTMRYTKDLGLHVGTGVGIGKRNDLRIGMKVAFINRTGGTQNISLSDIAGTKNGLTSRFNANGSGIGGDFGLQYRLPASGNVEYTTSFVWHDIGDTSFGGVTAINPPTRIEQDMIAGAAIRVPIGGGQNRRALRRYGPIRSKNFLTIAFDYTYLNKRWNTEPLPKHVHLGTNLDLPIISLQLGMNQTSLTYGFGFDLGLVKVAAASYAEELGSYAGQRTDRRYVLSVGNSYGFGGFK